MKILVKKGCKKKFLKSLHIPSEQGRGINKNINTKKKPEQWKSDTTVPLENVFKVSKSGSVR